MIQPAKSIRSRSGGNRGFTLIEVIAVLIILGILAAVALSRGTSTAEVSLKAQTEVLKSHIRYAQLRAMNMKSAGCNASFGIGIIGNSYFLFRDCALADKVVLPGASGDTVTLPGVTLVASSSTITFDDWGRPCSDQLGATLAAGSITLNSSGASETITITGNTGFVP
jgi:prepilin-type N-terminal cleavage/methylation domain-containing protein